MKWLIGLLTAATGLLHILIGFNWLGGQPGASTNWLLVLNGVGYLVLLAVFWTASGSRRGTIRWILLAYTLITLIGYFVINGMGGFQFALGLITKAIELLLVILLFLYRGSETVVAPATVTRTGGAYSAPSSSAYSAPAGSARAMTDVDAAAAASATAAGLGTAAAGLGTSTLGMGVAAAGAAAAAADETVDEVAGSAEAAVADDWSDRVDYAADTSTAAVYDTTESVGDKLGDAADWVGDTAGDAVDATGDTLSGAGAAVVGATVAAGDWVGDKVDDAGDAMGDAAVDVDTGVTDWAGEPVDTTAVFEAADDRAGAAADWVSDKSEVAVDMTSAGADWTGGDAYDTSGATVGDMVDTAGDAIGDAGEEVGERLGAVDAATLDAQQLAAEPSPEELRSELETYLRSFGSSSEFRKGVEYIEGVGPAMGERLRGAGVITVLDLMVNGATRRGRKHLSDLTGIAQSQILTWVNHIDLFRIKGVAEEYADLLEQSGVDTVVELAQRNPNNLFKKMNDINQQKQLVQRLPRQADVQDWVVQAKSLKRLVHY